MYPILPPAPSSFLSDPSPFSASSSSSVRPPSPPSLRSLFFQFPPSIQCLLFSSRGLSTYLYPATFSTCLSLFLSSFFRVLHRKLPKILPRVFIYPFLLRCVFFLSLSLSSCFPSFIDGHFISFRLHTHNDVCLPPFLEHGFLENNPRTCK